LTFAKGGDELKLAEALAERADLQTRIAQLRPRIAENARHQDGDSPAEDPRALIEEAERLAGALELVIRRVNKTNASTPFADGRTITDAIAERDVLSVRRKVYAEAAKAAAQRTDRFMRSEIKLVSALDVPELQRRVDDLSRQYRALDSRLQELNWSTELVD
jgi:hypothetical protein